MSSLDMTQSFWQDIGYCKQYGCSVLFLVKYKTLVSSSYEAICLLCAGLQQANSIFSMLSSGYKQANHPTFDSLGKPYCIF